MESEGDGPSTNGEVDKNESPLQMEKTKSYKVADQQKIESPNKSVGW